MMAGKVRIAFDRVSKFHWNVGKHFSKLTNEPDDFLQTGTFPMRTFAL